MKKLSLLAVLFAFGCGASEPEPEQRPEAAPSEAAGKTPEQKVAEIRAQIEIKKGQQRQEDINLGKVMAERLELDTKPASEAKTNRLAELAKIESDSKARKQALDGEIVELERRAQQLGAAPRAASVDDALDRALAAEEKRLKEEEEKRRARTESDASADKKRLEEAEKARAAEAAAREKEKIQAGAGGTAPAAAGADRPLFEEQHAAVILKIRAELQRFKRW